MGSFLRDIRFGIKLLWKDRAFTIAAVLTLAVCIGGNTAIFTIVHSVLLRPLPVPDANRIVMMSNQYPKAGIELSDSGVADYFDRLREISVLSEQAIFNYNHQTLELNGVSTRLDGLNVTPSFFRVVKVPPAIGRSFTEEDGTTGHNDKIILSEGLWQQMFAGDPNVLGRRVPFVGQSYTVVGVMPRGFQFFDPDVRFWVPAAFTPAQRADNTRLSSGWTNLAMLKPGATIAQVKTQVDALDRANLDRFPQIRSILINAGQYTRVEFLQGFLVRSIRPTLYLLWGGAIFVLLIGALNIANLTLARSGQRRKEIATRIALGAGRGQIARQLVTESVVLAASGGVAGIFLGSQILAGLTALGLDRIPRASEIQFDWTVIVFTIGIAIAAGILIGLVPLGQLPGFELNAVLHEESRSGTSSGRARAFRRTLVVAQVAVAFVLLIGAGLLLASFRQLLAVDPGFKAAGVIAASTTLPRLGYANPKEIIAFTHRAFEAIRQIPGVTAVGATSAVPFDGNNLHSLILAEGYPMKPGESVISPRRMIVTPGYFSALSISLQHGRYFDDHDTDVSTPVAIVDERLANRFWPNADPIGRRLYLPIDHSDLSKTDSTTQFFKVVGVVKEVRQDDLSGNANEGGAYYFPHSQSTARQFTLVVKSTGDLNGVTRTLRSEISKLDAQLPLFNVRTLPQLTDSSLMPRKASMLIALSFGLAALLLSAIGIYGVLAYIVSQRSREIGIRMALGCTSERIFGMVIREGLILVGLGVALGLIGSVALRGAIRNQIYGVQPMDPTVAGSVLAVLALVALVACILPARRATRVDPVVVLNGD